jgi:hypothetical protein
MRRLAMLCLVIAGCGAAPPGVTLLPADAPYPAGSLPALRLPGPHAPRTASYRLDVHYDARLHRITGTEVLTFVNPGRQPVSELPFHLYLNAFKNEDSLFAREAHGGFRLVPAETTDDAWGWIEVTAATIGGVDRLAAARYAPDATVMTLPLAAPLAPGATVSVSFDFAAQLPRIFARTGWTGDFAMVGQWFPKLGVLESDAAGQRWRCDPFHAFSEFYADFGSYDVTLDVPAGLVVAATGVLVERGLGSGGRQRLRWQAEDVHDFAWMADPHMQVASGRSQGGVLVLVYHRPEQVAFAGRHVEAAIRTLDTFSELVPYPWSVMTIVDPPPAANDGAGGMEYPTLVTTADDSAFAPPGVAIPEFVTVHEVGHNWFQGMLASDEVHDAWLDEGVNEFADGVVMDRWFGERQGSGHALGWHSDYWELHRLEWRDVHEAVPARTPSMAFPDYGAYGTATYARTALVLKTLEGMVGKDRMWAALEAYAQQAAFTHPHPDDFVRELGLALGEDLHWFLDPALGGTGSVELRIDDVQIKQQVGKKGVYGSGAARAVRRPDARADAQAPTTTEVLLTNGGGVPIEVDVEVVTDDGQVLRQRWKDHGRWTRLVFAGRAVRVTVDPDDRVLLERDKRDNVWRAVTPSLPAWQGASAVGEAQGLLLQAIGP